MGVEQHNTLENTSSFEDAVVRKVSKRLLTFLIVLYAISYLDRINIGFAALSMNKELGLTATMFGIAGGIFYLGYFFCEIPSNLILAKYGARLWIPRIMITWGIASAATMLAQGAHSLYIIRLIVGMAEAGFFPGILLYMTFWFPQSYRARANALLMLMQPLTFAFGAAVSGLILEKSRFLGLSGWRWLFFLEGFPAVIFGVIAYFYLTDRPEQAKWLTDVERTALEKNLDPQQGSLRIAPPRRVWSELRSPDVIMLSIVYFGLVMTLSANGNWTPQIVREVMAHRSLSFVGFATAIPGLCTALLMPLWGARSDRHGERTWHTVLPMVLAAAGWVLVALSAVPEIRMLGLIFSSMGAYSAMGVFWTVPPTVLSPAARPAGIAMINCAGIAAGFLSPMFIGKLKDLTHSFAASLLSLMVILILAAAVVLLMPSSRRVPASQPTI